MATPLGQIIAQYHNYLHNLVKKYHAQPLPGSSILMNLDCILELASRNYGNIKIQEEAVVRINRIAKVSVDECMEFINTVNNK